MTAGTLSVGVGALGIFVPLLPATPFFLLAAACYVRSSTRLYQWISTHRVMGAYIQNYRDGKGMPGRAKAVSIGVLWITLAASALTVQIWWVWAILGVVAVGVPLLILSLPGSPGPGKTSGPGGSGESPGDSARRVDDPE